MSHSGLNPNKQGLKTLHILLLSLIGLVPSSVIAQDYVTAGTAYNLDDNQVLYRELYTGLDENKSVRVDYVSPQGKTFATKTLVYSGELFQPMFTFEDTRDNEFASAQFEGARLMLTHGAKGHQSQKAIMDNAKLVVDAGFDAYIQLNWDKLMEGKRLKFDFALVNRLTTVQLEVRKIKSSESPVYDADYGRHWAYFRITPAKKIASLFADPINLAYDPKGKYLMRYHGRSNLDDNEGAPVDVRIEYEYLN